jgi:hypothetical protein
MADQIEDDQTQESEHFRLMRLAAATDAVRSAAGLLSAKVIKGMPLETIGRVDRRIYGIFEARAMAHDTAWQSKIQGTPSPTSLEERVIRTIEQQKDFRPFRDRCFPVLCVLQEAKTAPFDRKYVNEDWAVLSDLPEDEIDGEHCWHLEQGVQLYDAAMEPGTDRKGRTSVDGRIVNVRSFRYAKEPELEVFGDDSKRLRSALLGSLDRVAAKRRSLAQKLGLAASDIQ